MTTDNIAEMTSGQLRAELAQRDRKHKNNAKMIEVRGKELGKVRAELAQARVELSQLRKFWLNPARAAELRRKLAQARDELKDLQGANREYGRQLADVTDNREFWYKEAQDTAVEAEELKRQLAAREKERDYWLKGFFAMEMDLYHATEEEAIIVEAAQALAEATGKVHVGSSLREELAAARDNMNNALEYRSKAATKLSERLATLGTAEAALADCGIGGIFAEFDDLPDAIEQMAQHIRELTQEPVEVEMTDAEMVETLQSERRARKITEAAAHILSKALDECMQTVNTERRLRQEAEHHTSDLRLTITGAHEALDECRVRHDYDDGEQASLRTRIFWLNQRAERLEKAEQRTERTEEMEREIKQHIIALSATSTEAAKLRQRAMIAEARNSHLSQALNTESQLRREAERVAKSLHLTITDVREALNECGVEREGMSTRARVLSLGQRAERAEALAAERAIQLEEAEHYVNDCRRILTDARGALDEHQVEGKYNASITMRIAWLAQRAERAEALAQLVTLETAGLLYRLARYAQAASADVQSPLLHAHSWCNKDAEAARALTAQIREALDDGQA